MANDDKKVVEQLLGKKYGDWISDVREMLCQEDTPLSLNNGTWTVKKRRAMWDELGRYLFDEHLDKFRQIAVDVLREPDPQFELEPDERYMANVKGKILQHSDTLRKGLAETLALLGTQPEALKNCSRGKAESTAIISIREIFEDSDWVVWGTLNPLLPILAEASPDAFLTAVENALNKAPCPFDELFSQEGSGITGRNYMTGLLWALETLAWAQEYLVRTTVILGKLASYDPGGNWANRPANSLVTIFLPWMPQTIAPVDKRKAAVQTLQKELPEVAWKLLLNLLPNKCRSSSGSHKPEWRKIIPDDWEKGVTNKEYSDQVCSYAEMSVDIAKDDIPKLEQLIRNLNNLPEPSRDRMLEYLGSEEVANRSEEDRTPLWAALVEFASKHKKFSDANWALSPESVDKIEQVANSLAPQRPQNLYSRLFTQRDYDLYEERGNWEEQEKKLQENRENAIREIVKHDGLGAVFQFAERVESPRTVGLSLGFVAEDKVDAMILPALLETDNKTEGLFASGFVWARYCSRSWAWIDQLDTAHWSSTQIAQFLSHLPFVQKTWKYSAQLLGEHEAEYWSRAGVNPYQTGDDLGLAIDKLIQYDRPHAAITCLYRILHDKKPLDKTRALSALRKAISSKEPAYSIDTYCIAEIIKALQDDPETDQEDLSSIEWAYLPLLTGPGKQASPRLLEQKLASDPNFFCEAISLVFRSKHEGESDKESTEQQKSIAENLYTLLDDWATLPGMHRDGTFSVDDFNTWLSTVKAKCKQSGHLEVALSTIGKLLVHYIPDPSGLWIHKALAEALNADDAEKMRHGFSTGIFNSRGVHAVDPTGKPEKELAAKYRQQAEQVENDRYYRLAITLRRLADSYEHEAEQIIEQYKAQ